MSDRVYQMDGITSGDLCIAVQTTQLAPNYDIKIWHHTVLFNGKLEVIRLEKAKLNDWIRNIE